ncbi:MAG: glycosyltransferase family 87 protein [Anaerolineae bacterium]|nr:DUF2029 domain-containing protein [Anaerolineae bacterium]MDW8067657.1 glycosyltransferase family 87 protein [Anaerolineae bacterium]
MNKIPFLTPRRLRDYPRLIGIALWAAWGLEVLLRHGWLGGLGQVIGSDFIAYYQAGWLDRFHPDLLYDFQTQDQVQQTLTAPTPLPGLTPFFSPPHVALACRVLTVLPLPAALVTWWGLTLLLTLHAAWRLWYLLPPDLRSGPLPLPQFLVLIFSFFPFLVGWRMGQNHALTLWLVVGILEMERTGRPLLAGILAGLLLYKPHFVLGFLILWTVWREWRALAGFGAVAGAWVGADLALHGPARYGEYLALNPTLLGLLKTGGFPAFAQVTPFSLLVTLLPGRSQPLWSPLSGLWLLAGCLAMGSWGIQQMVSGVALRGADAREGKEPPALREQPQEPPRRMGPKIHPVWRKIYLAMYLALCRPESVSPRPTSGWMLALLFPLLVAPYTQLHDLLLLVPLLVLWAAREPSRCLLPTTVAVYLGGLFLPLLGAPLGLALPALIPVGVLFALIRCGAMRRDGAHPKTQRHKESLIFNC